MEIAAQIRLRFCRGVASAECKGGTINTNLDNALDFLVKTVPDFPQRLTGKRVVDFGCGLGWQSIAMAKLGIARSITGVDIRNNDRARANADANSVGDRVRFLEKLDQGEKYDVAISCSSFEHFSDPAAIVDMLKSAIVRDGEISISFAEPWWSPHGSHMDGFCRLP